MAEEAAAPDAAPAEAAPAETALSAPAPVEAAATNPLDGFQDETLRDYAVGKGFDKAGLEGVVKSYSHLEKLMSADKAGRTVVMPGPEADETAMNDFYTKLGLPEKAEGYELPIPEGDTGELGNWAKGVFHEAGLTAKQAAIVSEKWNEYIGGLQGDAATFDEQSAQQAEVELKREWGAAYDQKVNGINQAASNLGMSEDQLSGLHASMGPVAAMKFVDSLAGKLGERPVDVGGEELGSGMLTPQMASQELQKLGTDPEFMDAWLNRMHPSHKWAVEKKQNLSKMAAGQAA